MSMHFFIKNIFKRVLFASIIGGVFSVTLTGPIAAQEHGHDPQLNQTSLLAISGTFSDYIPYSQFNNYQYTGFGNNYESQYTILEYTPDENGLFQVAILMNDQAMAYVYQQRSNGLYELGHVENYGEVQDLRYSNLVNSGQESLILSSNMTVGYQYYSGYHNEYLRTVKTILPTYEKNGVIYQEVVAIEETGYADGSATWYYLAPKYGIICIERVDSQGNSIAETSLYEVYNDVYAP